MVSPYGDAKKTVTHKIVHIFVLIQDFIIKNNLLVVFTGFWEISADEDIYTGIHASFKFTEQRHRSYPHICEKVRIVMRGQCIFSVV